MQNHIPIGYKICYGKVEIDSDKSQTVMQIYIDYLLGKTLNQIAKDFTENSVPNANGRTNWTHGAVIRILENPQYLGDEFFPPLINKTVFDKVQQTRQEKMRKSPKREPQPITKTYPQKLPKIYIPQEVLTLDEQIKTNPNNLDLILKRAETFYKYTKIYNLNEGDRYYGSCKKDSGNYTATYEI